MGTEHFDRHLVVIILEGERSKKKQEIYLNISGTLLFPKPCPNVRIASRIGKELLLFSDLSCKVDELPPFDIHNFLGLD